MLLLLTSPPRTLRAVGGGSAAGPSHSRHFAATQQFGRFRSEADIVVEGCSNASHRHGLRAMQRDRDRRRAVAGGDARADEPDEFGNRLDRRGRLAERIALRIGQRDVVRAVDRAFDNHGAAGAERAGDLHGAIGRAGHLQRGR